MRIGIIGTGAMGSLLAAHLAPFAEISVLGTWDEAVRAITRNGIRVDSTWGTRVVSARAFTDPLAFAPVDVALIAVKSHQTQRAAEWARMILEPDGIALTLQNGLGNFEIIAEHVGAHRAALGVSMQGATLLGPAHVHHAGRGLTTLGCTPQTRHRLDALAEVLNRAGLETQLTEDMQGLIWGKLVVNSAINALTGLLQVPNGWLIENDDARAVMRATALETANVARALGVTLPYPDPAARAMQVAAATALNKSSTLQDVLRGAPTELDGINGAVVREGERLGVPTPINATLLHLFHAQRALHTLPLPLSTAVRSSLSVSRE